MSNKLLQLAYILATSNLVAYKDLFNSDSNITKPNLSYPISTNCYKNEHYFTIKGKQILATSRKDAIKKYNHKYK